MTDEKQTLQSASRKMMLKVDAVRFLCSVPRRNELPGSVFVTSRAVLPPEESRFEESFGPDGALPGTEDCTTKGHSSGCCQIVQTKTRYTIIINRCTVL